MLLGNKHYRDGARKISGIYRERDDFVSQSQKDIANLKSKQDDSVRSIAKNVGKMLGHLFFNKTN